MNQRQDGTGQWLMESDEFKTWLNGARKTLFCPGIPGAGKTMQTAIAIDHLCSTVQDPSVGIAYIYCNYRNRQEQMPVNLLASLLKQLLQHRSHISPDTKNLYERHIHKRSRPTLDEVSTALHSEMSRCSRVYILVDALDECTDEDGTRRVLLSRLRVLQAAGAVNLMMTSRFDPNIEQEFPSALRLEIRANGEDVKRYLEGQMFRLSCCVMKDISLRERITEEIIKIVDGMCGFPI
jgi:Cdc6-like AAA superfamily ATPase